MKRPQPSDSNDHRTLGFERLVFFSDAVFAIAITLLVLDLKLPAEVNGVLRFDGLAPKLVGFVVSFFVIGIYWLAHHRLFETIKDQDALLRGVNLIFLAGVAFLPFPTTLVAEGPGVVRVIVYALSIAAVGLLLVALTLAARRPKLLRSGETKGGTVRFVIRSLAPPIGFAGSCFIAMKRPDLAMYSWMLIYPLTVLAERIGRLAQTRIDGATAPAPSR